MDWSPPGSSVYRILQARKENNKKRIKLKKKNRKTKKEKKIQKNPKQNKTKQNKDKKQKKKKNEFSRQEYWSGFPCPSPGDLPDLGIEPRSPTLQILYHLSHQGSYPHRSHRFIRVILSHHQALPTSQKRKSEQPLQRPSRACLYQ